MPAEGPEAPLFVCEPLSQAVRAKDITAAVINAIVFFIIFSFPYKCAFYVIMTVHCILFKDNFT